jgi:plasmid stability protein
VPRTTLDLDAGVLRLLKRRAAREKRSLGAVASELLQTALAKPSADAVPPLMWIARDLGPPLIDLEDKDAVWAMVDEKHRR